MRKEVVYSFLALGAIPVTVSAADVTVAKDVITSSNGATVKLNLGSLVPGTYQLSGNVTSRVYNVSIVLKGSDGKALTLAEGEGTAEFNANEPVPVTATFTLTATTDVTVELTGENPGGLVGGFDFAPEKLQLQSFDASVVKTTLTDRANAAKATIQSYKEYDYDTTEDVKGVDAIITKIGKIADKYDDYKTYELWEPNVKDSKTTIDAEIKDALNKAAFAYVNNAISNGVKNDLNAAVKDLKEVLEVGENVPVGPATYLWGQKNGAKDQTDAINEAITEAYDANTAALKDGKAAEGVEKALETVKELNDAVAKCLDDFKGQAEENKTAYNNLKKSYTDLQAALDKVKDHDKTAAQAAVDKVKEIVEKNFSTAGQLKLATDDPTKDGYNKRYNDAKKLVDELTGKQAETDANAKTVAALDGLQSDLDKAKAAVAAAIAASKEGYPSGTKDPNATVATEIQKQITKLVTDAAAAAKAGTAGVFNSELKSKTDEITAAIKEYETESKLAVTNYDKVIAAINGYNKELLAADEWIKPQPRYVESQENQADYELVLGQVGKQIFELQNSIDKNMEAGGKDHWANMKELAGNIAQNDKDILDVIKGYIKPQPAYTENCDIVDNIIKEIENGCASKIYGKTTAAIDTAIKAIRKTYTDITKDAVTTDAAANAGIEKINALYKDLVKVREQAKTAEELVAGNEAAKVAADEAVTALNLANALSGINYVAYAEATGYSYVEANAKVPRKVDGKDWFLYKTGLATGKTCADDLKALNDAVKALNKGIEDGYKNETLAKDWETTLKAQVKAIQDQITAIKGNVTAEADNYKFFEDALTTYDEGADGLQAAITQAKEDVKDYVEYYTKVVIKGYEDDRAAIIKSMEASLNARTTKTAIGTDKTKGLIKSIEDLKAQVKKVIDAAKANKKAYDDLTGKWKEVQQEWNNTYSQIATGDESSKRDEYLKKLDELQNTLDAAKATIEEDYQNGNAANSKVDFPALKKEIQNLLNEQKEGYDKQIAADNDAAWEAVQEAYKAAKKAYADAVDTRDEYRTSNAELEEVIGNAAKELDDYLYKMEKKNPTQPDLLQDLDDLLAAAEKEYEGTVSPTKFHGEKHIQDIQETVVDPIDEALETFLTTVKDAVKEYWDGASAGYQGKVDAAAATILTFETYAADTKNGAANAKAAVKSVQDLITAGTNAAKDGKLAGVENALKQLKNIDDLLAQCVSDAAKADLNTGIAKREKYEQNLKDLGSYVEKGWEKKFEAATKALNEAKAKLAEAGLLDAEGYNEILDLLKECDDIYNPLYDDAKKAKDNDTTNAAACDDIIKEIQKIEASLNDAKALVDQYKYTSAFTESEQQIADRYATVEGFKKDGGAVAAKTQLIKDIQGDISIINKELVAAFGVEMDGLTVDIANLKSEYSKYIVKDDCDKELAAQFQKAIEDLQKEYDDIQKNAPAATAKNADIITATKTLLAFQEKVAKQQTLMSNTNSGDGDYNAVLAELLGAIDELAAEATLEGKDPWVGEQKVGDETLKAKMEELQAEIEALRTAIENDENLVYYQSKYVAEIDVVSKALDEVLAKVKELQKQVDASNAAYNKFAKVLSDLKAEAEAAQAEAKGYKNGETNQGKTDMEAILDKLAGESKALEDAHKTMTVDTDYELTDAAIEEFEADIEAYRDSQADNELTKQAEALKVIMPSNSSDWNADVWSKFLGLKDAIEKEIDALKKAIELANNTVDAKGKAKDVTSYEEFETLMAEVARIQAEIADFDAKLEGSKLGDVTGDGKITAADYTYIIDIVTGNAKMPEPGTDAFKAADINGDGVIDVVDASQLVNIILTGSPVRTNTNGARSTEALTVDQTVSTMQLDNSGEEVTFNVLNVQGNTMRMALAISNVNAYSNVQADIVLPAGMTIVGKSVAGRAEGHDIAMGTVDGVNRLLVISAKNAALTGNAGAVAYIDVEVSNDYNGGEIVVENIIAVTAEANYAKFGAVNGNVTGIDSITNDGSIMDKVYNLGGRLMDGLKKGINIINGKKVVVK